MSVDQTGFIAFGIAMDDSLNSLYQYLNEDVYVSDNEDDEDGKFVPDCLHMPVKYYWDLLAKYGLDLQKMGELSDTVLLYWIPSYHSACRSDVLLLNKNDLKIQETFIRSQIRHFLDEIGYDESDRAIGWLVGCYQW